MGRQDYKMVDVGRYSDIQSFPYVDGCTTFRFVVLCCFLFYFYLLFFWLLLLFFVF